MTVETAKPSTPDGRRIAVVIGSCGFSGELSRDLDTHRPDCVRYSWNPGVDGHKHISPLHLEAGVKKLKKSGVTHIVNAGAVSLDDINQNLDDPVRDAAAVRADAERYVKFPVLFYEDYSRLLAKAGIETLSPAGVFEQYALEKGLFGHVNSHDLADLVEAADRHRPDAEAVCARAMREEIVDLDETRIGYIPRAIIYEQIRPRPESDPAAIPEFKVLAIERKGTKKMLEDLPPPTHPGWRILLNVLPAGFPEFLDCPTISPEIIDLAKAKYIHLIGIDQRHGLIIDREATAELADKAGIVLYAF